VDALAKGGDRAATLRGYRRVWAVAMDNRVDLPGYKYYVDSETGERPGVYVAFVDLEPDETSDVEGVVFPVDGASVGALDTRERNYARADVTDRIDPPAGGDVHAYFGTSEARRRFERGRTSDTAVVSRAYLKAVGASTGDTPLPIRDLRRIDLPPQLAERPPRP
jgi:hypothetical protein